jgi:chromosome segregation ATPase
MVAFIAHAGSNIQANIMDVLPDEISVPALPYAQELTDEFAKLKSKEEFKDKFKDIEIPDLVSMQTVEINMSDENSEMEIPDYLVEMMKTSDVTTITENTKIFAAEMFDIMTIDVKIDIENGIDSGIDGITTAITDLDDSIASLQEGYNGVSKGIKAMQSAIEGQQSALSQLKEISKMIVSSMPPGIPTNTEIDLLAMIPQSVKDNLSQTVLDELSSIRSIDDLNNKITQLEKAISTLQSKVKTSKKSQTKMLGAINSLKNAKSEMNDTIDKMKELKNAIPSTFETAKENYIAEIDNSGDAIETVFQDTLNQGFKQVYLVVAISSAIALIIFAFYRNKKIDL